MSAVIGIVLAGGLSSRMGQDKALLEINGTNLIQQSQKILQQAGCQKVLVSRNETGFIQDRVPQAGPLAGIDSCIHWHPLAEGYLVIPVDMPGLTAELCKTLIEQGKSCFYQDHMLPCFIKNQKDLLQIIEQRLANGQRSVKGLLAALRADSLAVNELDIEQRLANTNTPQEWQAFLAR